LHTLQGGGADRGIMGSAVSDVGVGHFRGDRIQDLQDLGTVGAATEQGEGEVLRHARIVVCGLWFDWASFRAHPLPLYQGARWAGEPQER